MIEQTSNVDSGVATPTLSEMLDGIDAALAIPEPIGMLHGAVVYLRHDKRELSWDGVSRVSVDHPYLVGTKIREAALRRMGERT